MSLIEVLIASAVLLVVSVGLLPLFLSAAKHNIAGSDSSQASRHARSALEDHLALGVDDRRFDLTAPRPGHTIQPSSVGTGGEEMLLGDLFWDNGARAAISAGSERRCNVMVGGAPQAVDGDTDCVKLGDGGWIGVPADAKGIVLWRQRGVVRRFTYADISEGVIDQSGTQLVTLGHAHFFDRPLMSTDPPSSGHFSEQTAELRSERRSGDPGYVPVQLEGATSNLGAGSQRTLILRTF